jgi:DNA-binding response OmpR family regulator
MAKVLIVEDDTDIRTAYVYALTKAGFEVLEAPDGTTAMRLFENQRPDVILLDMLMPGMSGLDFLRETKAAARFPAMKIIALSNIDTPRVVKEAKELGVNDYHVKVDMTPHQMVQLVQHYLDEAGAMAPNQPE